MRKSLTLLILFSLLSAGFGDPGFMARPRAENIPAAVREASQAVVRYVSILEQPLVVSSDDYDAYEAHLVALPGFLSKLVLDNIRWCRKQNQKTCPIHYRTTASGFVAGAPDQLYVAFHSLRKWLQQKTESIPGPGTREEKFQRFVASKPEVPVLLFDANHKIIFDTVRNKVQTARLDAILPNSKAVEFFGWFGTSACDVVRIHLSQPLLVKPLTFRDRAVAMGEQLYGISFPDVMQTRQRELKVPDSDGFQLYFSAGKRFPVDNFVRDKHLSKEQEAQLRNNDPDKWLIFHNVDMTTGSSGGALVDAAGQLVSNLSLKWSPPKDDGLDRYNVSSASNLSGNGPFLFKYVRPAP